MNLNCRKRKKIGSPKKHVKTIHMPSSQASGKKIYAALARQNKAWFAYISRAIGWNYEF